jgi:hypothetical protein
MFDLLLLLNHLCFRTFLLSKSLFHLFLLYLLFLYRNLLSLLDLKNL